MWKREEIMKILEAAKEIDPGYEKFGASAHQYRLNPPIERSFVRNIEERYGFTLPEDYFRFITEVGDGGAGPDYGIMPFADFLTAGNSLRAEQLKEAYRHSLARAFLLQPMAAEEVENFAIVTREGYEKNPDAFFVCEGSIDNDELSESYGFYVLGTHGCQWDFGLIITGDRRGQVFDTDNEGAYGFVSESFDSFYQNWLEQISDVGKLQKELEERRMLLGKIHKMK